MQVVRKGPFEEVALYSGRNGVSEGVGQTWGTGGSGYWAEGIAETRASSPERGWGVRKKEEGGLSGWSEGSEGEETGGKARGGQPYPHIFRGWAGRNLLLSIKYSLH